MEEINGNDLSEYSPRIQLEVKGCERIKDMIWQIDQHLRAIENLANDVLCEEKRLEARLNGDAYDIGKPTAE